MPLTASKLLRVNISDDGLTATLLLHNEAAPAALTADEIQKEVCDLGLVLNAESAQEIKKFAQALAEKTIPEPIMIARGTAPVHDKNGRVEKLYETNAGEEGQPKSHYDRSSIISVQENQPLLRLHPPVLGKDGVDVFGKTIARKLGREAEVKLGVNVRSEGSDIVANCSGCVEFVNNKVWVQSKLEISGDVDFSVGNIDFSGDIFIARNILDLFKVRSHSNITVQGGIDAAEVHAEGDLFCNGGMTGKEKGVFSAGHDLHAKYITNAKVTAGNDIQVRVEMVNCEVNCKGMLIVEQGPLVGGHVVATKGVRVKQLGSDAGVKMLLEVGVDEDVRKKVLAYAPEVEKKRLKSAKVKQAVEPLLANQKYLNSEQKEKATELLYQAYEIDDEVEKMIDEIKQALETSPKQSEAVVEVLNHVYAGITLRFPMVEAVLETSINGPVKFMVQKIGHNLTVTAVDSSSGGSHPLKTGSSRDKMWTILDKLFNPAADPHQR